MYAACPGFAWPGHIIIRESETAGRYGIEDQDYYSGR
jgi:hypothetical protein